MSESLMAGYESFLIKAVDDGFNVLGKRSSEIIYDVLESDYGITKEDIPKQFMGFSKIFRRTIGSGAEAILELIIRRFYSKLEIEPPAWNNVDDAIAEVQQFLFKSPVTVTLPTSAH